MADMKTQWTDNRPIIAIHRKRLGLSPEALGAQIGVTGQTIRNWESGLRQPKQDNLSALANLFRISPLAFFMLVPVRKAPRLVKGARQQ